MSASTPAGELRATVLFHLNLLYSSIEARERREVVRRCYRPMLALLDEVPELVLAVEAGAHTLELAAAIDPDWLALLRARIEEGRVELVGSGDSQVVGPLVPAEVHRRNQLLGAEGYERVLGVRPRVALVNELAFSQGVVDGYLDAGYEALYAEWNNPRRRHPEWEERWRYRVSRTASPAGREIALLWADTIAFQKLQRAAVGELDEEAYARWVLARAGGGGPRHLALYAGDAEVFDHRPGRYEAEPPRAPESEWGRIARLLGRLARAGVRSVAPSAVLDDPAFADRPLVRVTSAADPVPVKKQPKYNATRWALTGRDDLGLNAACHARARQLAERGGSDLDWRALCRAWTSDLRTHLTEERWRELVPPAAPPARARPRPASAARRTTRARESGHLLALEADGVSAVLDLRRGLAVRELAFPDVHPRPLAGTIEHGEIDDVAFAADWFTGHLVVDVPAHRRATDLEPVRPEIHEEGDSVCAAAHVATALGTFAKRVRARPGALEIEWDLSQLGARPIGTVRAGFVTLFPGGLGERLFATAASGGAPERLPVEGTFDHGAPVSALVSARAAFGATDGRFALDDGEVALEIAWDPAVCPALPLLAVHAPAGRRLARACLSLGEVDETLRPGAPLRDLALVLTARRR